MMRTPDQGRSVVHDWKDHGVLTAYIANLSRGQMLISTRYLHSDESLITNRRRIHIMDNRNHSTQLYFCVSLGYLNGRRTPNVSTEFHFTFSIARVLVYPGYLATEKPVMMSLLKRSVA